MSRWEDLEEWLYENDTAHFTVHDLAASRGISTTTATLQIQAYLEVQRRPESNALYVLKREGRTRAAVWSVGHRMADSRVIESTLYEDIVVKVKRAFEPDIRHLAERNPKLVRYAERKIEAVTTAALVMLRTVLDDAGEEE